MNKYLKGSLLLTSAKILDLVVDLLNVAIISRIFTLNEYGLYSQIILISAFFSAFINLGLPSSINFFLAKEEEINKKKEYISNIILICNIIGFILFIILFYSKGYIANYFVDEKLNDFGFIFALLPWMKLGILLRDNVFIVMNKVSNAIYNRVIMSLIRLSLPIIMVIFNLTFINYIYLLILIELILFLYVQISIIALFQGLSLKALNIKKIKEIFGYSIPLGLALMIGTINVQFDKLIIGKYFNTEEFAIYVNMSREIPVAALTASIVTIIMPTIVSKMKNKEYSEIIVLWKKTISFSFFIISPIIAILLIMSQETIILLYSAKYLEGINVFRIYILVLYFRIIYFGMILNAAGKTKKILISSILSLVLNLFLSVLLIHVLGFTGPAWATLISFLLMALYQLRETSIVVECKIRELFPWKDIIKVLIKDIIMVFIALTLKLLIFIPIDLPSIWRLVIITLLWSLVTLLFYIRFMKNRISF
jgi:O-antigen/teichoic acid export membrane protein